MWRGTKEDPETRWPLSEASLPILSLSLFSASFYLCVFSISQRLFRSVSLQYFDVVQVYSGSAVLLRAPRCILRAAQAGACTEITLLQTGMCGNLPSGYLCNLHLKLVRGQEGSRPRRLNANSGEASRLPGWDQRSSPHSWTLRDIHEQRLLPRRLCRSVCFCRCGSEQQVYTLTHVSNAWCGQAGLWGCRSSIRFSRSRFFSGKFVL